MILFPTAWKSPLHRRVVTLYAALIAFNATAWLWAFLAFRGQPLLLGTCVLCYSLALRHAVDADHIAAIDNVTRKLMQADRRPIAVGLMFSLGHSTIVVLVSAGIAVTSTMLKGHLSVLREMGDVIGTLVSTGFLFAIALMNLYVLRSVVRAFRHMRRGEMPTTGDVDLLLAGRGWSTRVFGPLFRLVTKNSHIYLLGFLFGLGFDTATEVGLFGISAASAGHGMPIWTVMVFPVLFTAGMTLIDTTDNILMLGAYGWAFVKPVRKLYYNLTMTTLSVLVALLVGSIEALTLIADRLRPSGWFWDGLSRLNDHFGMLGYLIVGVFAGGWLLSVAFYRWQHIEAFDASTRRGSPDSSMT
jgi:high-affinity nickel-transport protein